MGNYGEKSSRKIEIENPVLFNILLKYKENGFFNKDLLRLRKIAIAEVVDQHYYAFRYDGFNHCVPIDIIDILPKLLLVLNEITLLTEDKFQQIKNDLITAEDEIIHAYKHVFWNNISYDYPENRIRFFEKTFELEQDTDIYNGTYLEKSGWKASCSDISGVIKWSNSYRPMMEDATNNSKQYNSVKQIDYNFTTKSLLDIQNMKCQFYDNEELLLAKIVQEAHNDFLIEKIKKEKTISIDFFDFGARNNAALRHSNIRTLDELSELSVVDLCKIRNICRIEGIIALLNYYNIHLAGEEKFIAQGK